MTDAPVATVSKPELVAAELTAQPTDAETPLISIVEAVETVESPVVAELATNNNEPSSIVEQLNKEPDAVAVVAAVATTKDEDKIEPETPSTTTTSEVINSVAEKTGGVEDAAKVDVIALVTEIETAALPPAQETSKAAEEEDDEFAME